MRFFLSLFMTLWDKVYITLSAIVIDVVLLHFCVRLAALISKVVPLQGVCLPDTTRFTLFKMQPS